MVPEIFGFTERKAALRQMRYEALQLSDMCDCSRVEIQRRKQPSEIGTPIKRRVGWNVPEESHFEAGHFYAGSGSGSGRGLSSPPPSSSFGHHACQLSLNTPPRPKFPALPNCERFKQSSPFRVNPDVLPDGESHLANIVCARSALRQESNDIAFQEQFRADPATSHGMLVAGCLRAKVYAAAVPRGATSIPADAESRTNSALTGRRRNQSCPDRSAGMSWHRSRAAGEERSKD